jgi:hypothetical protein
MKPFIRFALALLVVGLAASTASAAVTRSVGSEPRLITACHQPYWRDQGAHVGHTKKMVRCLSKQHGIRVSTAEAMHVASCESGFYDKAGKDHSYHGIYQEGDNEFRAWSHQGPHWMNREFNVNGWRRPKAIWDARANTLAAMAHASRYGWGAWSCQ